jgi:hypothetical protein
VPVTAFHVRAAEDVPLPPLLGGEIINVTGIVLVFQVPSLIEMVAL